MFYVSNKEKIKCVTIQNFIKENPNNIFSEYSDFKHIANCQFGELYLCTHKQTNAKRCMKVYNKESMRDSPHNKFEEEIEIVSAIDHPHVMKVFEFYQDNMNYYLIIEYLKGGDLFDFVKKTNEFTEEIVCTIIEQILSALYYLHKHKIVHRDLKPENIMLSRPGDITSLKIIDFGTSKRVEPGIQISSPIGTRYYMAPEMLRAEYDFKVDVWSCGVIMYILLVGYPPFNGHNDNEIMMNIIKKPVVFYYEDWKDKTPGAINLLMQMLDKDPMRRIDIQHIFLHNWFKRHFNRSVPINTRSALSKLEVLDTSTKLEKAIRIYLLHVHDIKHEEEKLIKVFKSMDKNNDGVLDVHELTDICIKNSYFLDVKQYMEAADVNNDGLINYSEFLMTALNYKMRTTKAMLLDIFNVIDANNDGYISKCEAIRFFNLDPKDKFIDVLFDEVDINKDLRISLDEFLQHLDKLVCNMESSFK